MRPQDIVIGESYRLRDTPRYSFVKAVEVLKPKQHPNTHGYAIVKCIHSIDKNDEISVIRYFRSTDMIKCD